MQDSGASACESDRWMTFTDPPASRKRIRPQRGNGAGPLRGARARTNPCAANGSGARRRVPLGQRAPLPDMLGPPPPTPLSLGRNPPPVSASWPACARRRLSALSWSAMLSCAERERERVELR